MGRRAVIVLDTHVFLWWVNRDDALRPALAERLASESLGVAAITCWEVSMLVAKRRILLGRTCRDWLEAALAVNNIALLNLTPAIAALSNALPGEFHGDPADRMIVATAMEHGALLATEDRAIREWGRVKVL